MDAPGSASSGAGHVKRAAQKKPQMVLSGAQLSALALAALGVLGWLTGTIQGRSVVRYRATPWYETCRDEGTHYTPTMQPVALFMARILGRSIVSRMPCPGLAFVQRCLKTSSSLGATDGFLKPGFGYALTTPLEDCILETQDVSELLAVLPWLARHATLLAATGKALASGLLLSLRRENVAYLDLQRLIIEAPSLSVTPLLAIFQHDATVREHIYHHVSSAFMTPRFLELDKLPRYSVATAAGQGEPVVCAHLLGYILLTYPAFRLMHCNFWIKQALLEHPHFCSQLQLDWQALQLVRDWTPADVKTAMEAFPTAFLRSHVNDLSAELKNEGFSRLFDGLAYNDILKWALANLYRLSPYEIAPSLSKLLQESFNGVDIMVAWILFRAMELHCGAPNIPFSICTNGNSSDDSAAVVPNNNATTTSSAVLVQDDFGFPLDAPMSIPAAFYDIPMVVMEALETRLQRVLQPSLLRQYLRLCRPLDRPKPSPTFLHMRRALDGLESTFSAQKSALDKKLLTNALLLETSAPSSATPSHNILLFILCAIAI